MALWPWDFIHRDMRIFVARVKPYGLGVIIEGLCQGFLARKSIISCPYDHGIPYNPRAIEFLFVVGEESYEHRDMRLLLAQKKPYGPKAMDFILVGGETLWT